MAAYAESLKAWLAQAVIFFRAVFGDWKGIQLLCAMMLADVATGFLRGALGKSDKTETGRLSVQATARGLMRKMLMLLVVYLSAMLDSFAGLDGVLRGTANWFYIGNEGLSVLENLMHLGVPVPGRLRALLASGKKGG